METLDIPTVYQQARYPTRTIISQFRGPWYFLSNFYPSKLTWEGIDYFTAEHAMHAGKTLNPHLRLKISDALTPHEAKKMGRKIDLRRDWNTTARYQVMRGVLRAKFTRTPGRIAALLSTGDAYLIEGNTWHDQHWGSCRCGRPECVEPGGNHLGLLLMELRDTLSGRSDDTCSTPRWGS
jgi:ribA/ribD-fused uncharacterized protein